MIFNNHFDLVGTHAFLSASKYSWLNYDDEKIDVVYRNSIAAQRGTELHAFAAKAITLGVKLPRTHTTLNDYVNDAIGYRMVPEQVLFYSGNVFGTADTISFRKGQLRVHDLKTGVSKASILQLEIYSALFCLEYRVKPAAIAMELRIYQSDEVIAYTADPDDILHIMDKIIAFDARINDIRMEEQR